MLTALILLLLFIVFFDVVLTLCGIVLPIAGVIGLVWLIAEVFHLPY